MQRKLYDEPHPDIAMTCMTWERPHQRKQAGRRRGDTPRRAGHAPETPESDHPDVAVSLNSLADVLKIAAI